MKPRCSVTGLSAGSHSEGPRFCVGPVVRLSAPSFGFSSLDERDTLRGMGFGEVPPRTSLRNSLGTLVLALMTSPSGPTKARANK